MARLVWLLLSSLSLTAFASPIPESLDLSLSKRDTVSDAQLADFKFYAQYAGAASCNSQAAIGSTITCSNDVCPDVTAAEATVLATYFGNETDTEGYLAKDPTNKLLVLSFRGSHSAQNFIQDATFLQEDCDDLVADCKIHSGFAAGHDEVKAKVATDLAAAVKANPDFKIIATGHSLGAAIATLAGSYLRKAGYAMDLYLYGSPRVGNEAYVQFVMQQDGLSVRITHLDDPVPRLPPIFTNYKHISPEFWLSDGTSNTTEYTAKDIKICVGTSNTTCNGGTTGFDTNAHLFYFEHISGCGSDDVTKRDLLPGADVELEARMTALAEMDAAFTAAE